MKLLIPLATCDILKSIHTRNHLLRIKKVSKCIIFLKNKSNGRYGPCNSYGPILNGASKQEAVQMCTPSTDFLDHFTTAPPPQMVIVIVFFNKIYLIGRMK